MNTQKRNKNKKYQSLAERMSMTSRFKRDRDKKALIQLSNTMSQRFYFFHNCNVK